MKKVLKTPLTFLLALLVVLALLAAAWFFSDSYKNGSPADSSDEGSLSCTVSISCSTALENSEELRQAASDGLVPEDGVILSSSAESFTDGETAFDVIKRVTAANGVQLEFSVSPAYNSAYIEGIANLYASDYGEMSGWMFSINGEYASVSCSDYVLQDGDDISWAYTCDMGADLGWSGE